MKSIPKNNGFTIVEALIIVVIVAIIIASAVPTFTSVVKNQRMSAVTNEIISTLQTARTEAVKRSTTVSVCFRILDTGNQCQDLGTTTDRTNFIYAFIDSNANQQRDPDEEQLYISNKLSDQVLFKHPNDSSIAVTKSIMFGPKGDARFGKSGDPVNRGQREGVFALCDDRKDDKVGRVIKIGNTGRAQASLIRSGDGVTCN